MCSFILFSTNAIINVSLKKTVHLTVMMMIAVVTEA